MATDEEKARKVYLETLTSARDQIRSLLSCDPLPRDMREDIVDVLEHLEDIIESETPEERDQSVDKAIGEIDG